MADLAASGVSTGAAGRSSQGQRMACTACRALKTRCLENEDPSVPCRRCTRLHLSCVYSQEKRGRKPRHERSRYPPDTGSSAGPSFTNNAPQVSAQFSGIVSSTSTSAQGVLQDVSQTLASLASPVSDRLESRQRSDERRGQAVADYLDPEVTTSGSTFHPEIGSSSRRTVRPMSNTSKSIVSGDPTSLGLLSDLEAQTMLDYFYRHLNPLIGLLDPKLHTLSFIQQSSSILLSSILAATSTFARPDLHLALRNHNQTLLNRAFADAVCDVGLVQGIIISVYWKNPLDRTAWLKIGWAIRMGYQMRWHLPWTVELPEDEIETRIVLDAERTWFCLWCLDRSRTFDLPSSIQPTHIGDIIAWIDNHRKLSIGQDAHLAVSMEQITLRGQLRWLRSIGNLSADDVHTFAADIMARQQRINERWYGKGALPRADGLSEDEVRALYWLSLEPRLELLRMEFDLAGQHQISDLLQRSMMTLLDIVNEVEALGRDGLLKYLFDFASCALSTLILFVQHIFLRLSSFQKGQAINILKRVHKVTDDIAGDDPEQPTAFIANFVTRALRQIHESQPVSRAVTPPSDSAPMLSGDATMDQIFTDLDAFLGTHPQLPDTAETDGQYWSTLFGTEPTWDRPFWER